LRILNLASYGRGALGRSIVLPVFALTGILALQINSAKADPVTELRALSVFRDADLGKLAGGEVLAARGGAVSSGRALSVESAYIIKAPLKSAVGLQQKWTPNRHPELRVYLQGDLSGRASDFQRIESLPSNSSVKALVDATLRLPGDASRLQLSQAEVRSFAPGGATSGTVPASVSNFWSKVLFEREQSFISGGLSALSPYETTGSTIRASEEVSQLIKDSSKVQSQFAGLIAGSPIGGGRGSLSGSPWWQVFEADGQAAVTLGSSYQKQAGDGWQLADLQYYASGGIYALVAFYQLWPVQIDGKEATLVWRVDLISASALGNLRGVERLGSGAAMMREVQKNVRAFLRDVNGS
jgi:hypothetical protein